MQHRGQAKGARRSHTGSAGPLVIGHRGASAEAPENTIAAFRLAWEQGADGVEGDFRLTRDGAVVCIHDAATGRVSGRDVAVAEATLGELRGLDVGAWKGARWKGERIPALGEVLAEVPPGKWIYIEVKGGPDMVAPLAGALGGGGCARPDRIAILSFDVEVARRAKAALPWAKALLLLDLGTLLAAGIAPHARDALARTLDEIGADGVGANRTPTELVELLRETGRELHVWTVNDPGKARRLARLGVVSITTDVPGKIRGR